jgi:hypothetical protein
MVSYQEIGGQARWLSPTAAALTSILQAMMTGEMTIVPFFRTHNTVMINPSLDGKVPIAKNLSYSLVAATGGATAAPPSPLANLGTLPSSASFRALLDEPLYQPKFGKEDVNDNLGSDEGAAPVSVEATSSTAPTYPYVFNTSEYPIAIKG